ncbi:MAG: thymidine phosphorylase [Longimicrobiaceae bacterium]
MNAVALIDAKRRGQEHSADEISFLLRHFLDGRVSDYQMAAWLMAVCWRGMTGTETLALTRAMVGSGATLAWDELDTPPVDKHSTGGVGDKTSLVLVPLMAAAGLPFVKMSGRGLGHTGGTLDKLEAIPGFSVELGPDLLRQQVKRIGCALAGQSAELVPADGKLYELRDLTATVESVPLIASSIMSKKLAAGAPVIVLDVKYGSGAFMPTVWRARELALAMVAIGTGAGRRVRALLSPMEQPLGRTVGNALEVREAIESLRGGGPEELWALVRELGAHQMMLAGVTRGVEDGRERLDQVRASGRAAEKFAQLVEAQGGDPRVVDDPDTLPAAPVVRRVLTAKDGFVAGVDARRVAAAALALGAGRKSPGDTIDPAVGVRLLAKVGERPAEDGALAEVHASSERLAGEVAEGLRSAYRLTPEPVPPPSFDFEVVKSSS